MRKANVPWPHRVARFLAVPHTPRHRAPRAPLTASETVVWVIPPAIALCIATTACVMSALGLGH